MSVASSLLLKLSYLGYIFEVLIFLNFLYGDFKLLISTILRPPLFNFLLQLISIL